MSVGTQNVMQVIRSRDTPGDMVTVEVEEFDQGGEAPEDSSQQKQAAGSSSNNAEAQLCASSNAEQQQGSAEQLQGSRDDPQVQQGGTQQPGTLSTPATADAKAVDGLAECTHKLTM